MEKMHVIVFQHTPEEPMGYFETICREWKIPFDYIRLFETNEVPKVHATHVLLLGGPMSVNDEKDYPYLSKEKKSIRSLVKSGTPVLGICLGAQLIANAFGGKEYPCNEEVGWQEIRCNGTGILNSFPSMFRVFQMHGETFDIPINGRILCVGNNVRNQAFNIGSATGLQFHFEITEDLIKNWIRTLSQTKRDAISRDTDISLTDSNSRCRVVAKRFFGKYGKNRIGKED